jgi:hypothetical protein
MTTKHWILCLVLIALMSMGIEMCFNRTASSSAAQDSYDCSSEDTGPNDRALHPECYCESDDESLPPGEGC